MSETSRSISTGTWWVENVLPSGSDCTSMTPCTTPGQRHKLRDGIPMSVGTPFRGTQEIPRSPLANPGQPTQLKLDFAKTSDVSCDDDIQEHEETVGAKQRPVSYLTPRNVLHPGRQIPRTPAPGILPALPSQRFDYEEYDIGEQGPGVGGSNLLMSAKPQITQCDAQKKGKKNKREPTKILNKFTDELSSSAIPTGRQLPRTPPVDIPCLEEMPPPAVDQSAASVGREGILQARAAGETHENLAIESQVKPGNQVAAKEMHKLDDANVRKPIVAENTDDNQSAVSNHDSENALQFSVECTNTLLPSSELEDQTTDQQINTDVKESINCSIPLRTTDVVEVGDMVKQLGGYEHCTSDLIFLQHKRQMDILRELEEKHISLTREHKKLLQYKEYLVSSVEKVQQDEEQMTKNVMSTVQQALELQGSPGRVVTALADALGVLPSLDIAQLRRQQQLQAARGKELLLEVESCTAELLARKSHLELAIREKDEEFQKEVTEASAKLQQEEEEVKKLQAILEKQKKNIKATESKTLQLHRLLQEDMSRSEGTARRGAESHAAEQQQDPELQRVHARLRRLKQRKECAERRQNIISAILAKPL